MTKYLILPQLNNSRFRKKKKGKKERKKQKSEKNPIRDFDLYVFFFDSLVSRYNHRGYRSWNDFLRHVLLVYRGFPIGDWKGEAGREKLLFFRNGRFRPGNCRSREQEKSQVEKCEVLFVDRIKGKGEAEREREREVEMETKLMKKKKGKKWKKFFPSCAHVRFERGRIQHSRVPFSSGVALRCHTFPTLDVETYTFAPVHIVVCLQRSRERKQPRG